MNVKLGSNFEQFINQKVQSGDFLSPSEVVREALRLLQQKDAFHRFQLESLRREIDLSRQAVKEGRYTEYTDEMLPGLVAKIEREGRRRLSRSRKRAG